MFAAASFAVFVFASAVAGAALGTLGVPYAAPQWLAPAIIYSVFVRTQGPPWLMPLIWGFAADVTGGFPLGWQMICASAAALAARPFLRAAQRTQRGFEPIASALAFLGLTLVSVALRLALGQPYYFAGHGWPAFIQGVTTAAAAPLWFAAMDRLSQRFGDARDSLEISAP